jgi:Domain of unknown function (DUF5916)/Carbohydrate family 9 binding domain-like
MMQRETQGPPRVAAAKARGCARARAVRVGTRRGGGRRRLRAFAAAFLCAALCGASARTASAQQVASLGGASKAGASKAGTSTPRTPAAPREARPERRLASVRAGDAPEGSRVVVTSDSPLDDYTARRSGDRFHIRIPRADARAVSAALAPARGYTGARVEQSGADALLSFDLDGGATASVRQHFNRREVLFAAPRGESQSGAQDAKQSATQDQKQSGSAGQGPPAPTPKPSPPAPPSALTGAEAAPSPSPVPSPAPSTSDSSTPREAAGAARVAAAGGRTVALPPEKASPVAVPKFDRAPAIDGKLDDEIWQRAARFKDFYQIQPGDNISPSRPTEMLMGYDSKTLYIAVRATDDPSKVRATIPKRDGIFGDDYVGFYLDTFNDRRKAYALFFSPLGVQADGIYTEGQGEDYSLDIVMESKGSMTSDGYVIEVAIPFKSLRYEAGRDKVWNVQLFRRIQHLNGELDSWMPISRDVSGTLNQAGRITGLEGISTERTLEVIPSLTLSETGRRVRALPPLPFPDNTTAAQPPDRLVNQPIDYDFGVTAKYTLTPTVTLDFAYNPDFAQVEADATVVTANQRFPIFFGEKRPFFLEGREIFETRSTIVHTRAIVDPDYAVKLTGKRGRNSFGLIFASDNAPGNFSDDERDENRVEVERLRVPRREGESEADFNERLARATQLERGFLRFLDKNATIGVLRLKRDVGKEHSVGLFGTTYNFVDRYNHVGGIDGRFKIDPKTVATFELIGTATRDERDPATGELLPYRHAAGYSWMWDYTGRNFGYVFEGAGRTQDYRTDVGFVRRTNTNNAFFAWRVSTDPNPKAILTEFRLQNFTGSNFDWQGRHQNWENGTNINFQFAHQTFVQIGLNYAYERLFEEEFGSFFGEDSERSTYIKTIFVFAERTFNKQFSGFAFVGTRRGIFDLDFGAGPRFPRVSPAALLDPSAPLDPGPGNGFDIDAGVTYKPTSALNMSLNYTKARLVRRDTDRVAFDDNIFAFRSTYQFTRFLFARARMDYDTLAANVRGQFLFGWTPNPGTAFYAGYNDDLNRNGFNPFTGQLEPGFRRNGRTFFIKASYLFRRSFE